MVRNDAIEPGARRGVPAMVQLYEVAQVPSGPYPQDWYEVSPTWAGTLKVLDGLAEWTFLRHQLAAWDAVPSSDNAHAGAYTRKRH